MKDMCPICDHGQAVVLGKTDHGNRTIFSCPRCSRFTIGKMAAMRLAHTRGIAAKLSAWIRDHDEFDRGAPTILQHNLQAILSALPGHEDMAHKERILFGAIRRRTTTLGQSVVLTVDDDYPLGHVQSALELTYLLRVLNEQGLIQLTESHDQVRCEITPKGWKHMEEQPAPDVHGSQRTEDVRERPRDVIDVTQHHFDVALSFPGEYRQYVEDVANNLAYALGADACFYDKHYRAQLAVPNADVLLQEIYRERSRLVVAFVCREYDEKKWCGIEWRKIRERVTDGGARDVMYVRLGQGDVVGMTTLDGYIDAREETPEEVAHLIVERLQVTNSRRRTEGSNFQEHRPRQPDSGTPNMQEARPKSESKLIASVENLLRSTKICQDVFSGAMTPLNLFTVTELDEVFRGQRNGTGMIEYMLEEYRDMEFVTTTREKINEPLSGVEELFVTARLWELYVRLVQIHGRLAMLFHMSFERGSYVDWRKDKATMAMLKDVVGDKRLAAATARDIGGTNDLVQWLNEEFMKEARRLMR